jgi:hypothetical protein
VFEPETERFTILWRAQLKLQRDIFEMSQLVVGKMSRAWWRSIETGKTYYPSLGAAVRKEAMAEEDA